MSKVIIKCIFTYKKIIKCIFIILLEIVVCMSMCARDREIADNPGHLLIIGICFHFYIKTSNNFFFALFIQSFYCILYKLGEKLTKV
jgi:hypothetical protein